MDPVTTALIIYKGLNIAGEIPSLAYRKAVSEFMAENKGLKPTTVDHQISVDNELKK